MIIFGSVVSAALPAFHKTLLLVVCVLEMCGVFVLFRVLKGILFRVLKSESFWGMFPVWEII